MGKHETTRLPGVRLALDFPAPTLLAVILLIIVCAAGLPNLRKDPSVDAFVPDDHPAAVARDAANAIFGLEDPVIVGLASARGDSAFQPKALEALRRVHDGVRRIDGVKKNDVISLASENAILDDDGELAVEPIIASGAVTPESAALAWERFQAMPMLQGLLASPEGDFLTLIAPVTDPNHAEEVVAAIRALAEAEAGAAAGTGLTVHVAGVAAMNARLAGMVESDTRIFVPAAIAIVFLILLLALRRPIALIGPMVIIVGSAAIAIGAMGWLDARYYLITTALPVVIMAIAVADSLHVSTYYLRARAEDARLSARQAAEIAVSSAITPVILTSITTIAAFIGLSFGAAMRPISEFGLFAALGVAAACLLTLTALPAILILTDLKPAASGGPLARDGRLDRSLTALTQAAFDRPLQAVTGVALVLGALLYFALQAEFDYERQRYFTQSDQVRVADRAINDRLGGVNFLDVVVRAPEEGGLMTPEALAAIAELRRRMAELPLVVKASGLDEYMALMHAVLTGAEDGALPKAARAPAQYMFLYETSGAPEDFKQEIDYDYTTALLRAQLSTDSYVRTLPTVHELEKIAADWSLRSGLSAEISGRVAVNDGWMTALSENHFRGLGLAVALVFLTTLLVFRSVSYALFAMAPVAVGVISVYAAMGAVGVDIAPATSMTAAIATGLGVDFGIHLISHVRKRRAAGASHIEAFTGLYMVVARACFYSAIALGCALAVVCFSSAPPLRWFGFLVSFGAFGSLLGALVIVPALWAASGVLERTPPHVSTS